MRYAIYYERALRSRSPRLMTLLQVRMFVKSFAVCERAEMRMLLYDYACNIMYV